MKKTLLTITVLTLALETFSVAAAGDCEKTGKTAGAVCGTNAVALVSTDACRYFASTICPLCDPSGNVTR